MYTDNAAVNPVVTIDRPTSTHTVTTVNSYDSPIFYRGHARQAIVVQNLYGADKVKPDRLTIYADGFKEAVIDRTVAIAAPGSSTFAWSYSRI